MAKAKREDGPDHVTVQMPEDSGPQVCIAGTTLDLDEDRCVSVSPAQAAVLCQSHGGQPFRAPQIAPRATTGNKQTGTGGAGDTAPPGTGDSKPGTTPPK